MALTQNEAIEHVVALGTAMLDDDKIAREFIYGDLDKEDLKKVLRWAIRWLLRAYGNLMVVQGHDPRESWTEFAHGVALSIVEEELDANEE